MKNRFFFVLVWLLSNGVTHTLHAQSKIEDIIQNLDKKLVSVTTGKDKTDPSVTMSLSTTSVEKRSPCGVVFTIEETDSKGKTEQLRYEIGLSDLSSQLLKAATKGSTRLVEVVTKDRQDYIKFSKDGEFKGYENKFNLPCFDNDAAKEVIDLLKSGIEACEKMPSESCAKPIAFNDATNQLKSLLGKIIINDLQVDQELVFDKSLSTKAFFTMRLFGKSK